jgi:hypothetical protein
LVIMTSRVAMRWKECGGDDFWNQRTGIRAKEFW